MVTSSHPKRPRDPNQLAEAIIDTATGQKPDRDSYARGRKENRIGARMNKNVDESSRQTAKMNRERLALPERPAILVEIEKKAEDIRTKMARLREQRLAKEAQEARTEISEAANRPAKATPKKRFR